MGNAYWGAEFMYKNVIENKSAIKEAAETIYPKLNINVYALNGKLGYTYFPKDIFPYLDFSIGLGLRYRDNALRGMESGYSLDTRGKIYSRIPEQKVSVSINFGVNIGFGVWRKQKP